VLWVAATSIDSLLAITLADKSIRRFCLITDSWVDLDAPGKDTQHFNSLCWLDNRLYVLAHKLGQGSSLLRSYDRNMKRSLVWTGGREAHNICPFDGQMLVLDSRGGRILGTRGLEISVCESNLYARGMVIQGSMAVVAVFRFGARDTRTEGDAILKLVDLAQGSVVKEILLEKAGNIQDIQLWNA
jgi:hypothetical protein